MRLSDKGAEFIAQFEGFSPVWYLDAVSIPTIGFGHVRTRSDGYSIVCGFDIPISKEDGLKILGMDAKKAEIVINRLVKVSLSQHEFDALVSFVFNVGGGAFEDSTLLKLLNASDRQKAAEQFKRWNKAGGKVLKGLTRRREAEAALFRDGKY